MRVEKKRRLVQQVVNGLLITMVVGLLAWASTRYKLELDWTYGHRNTLSKSSQMFLQSLHGPVKFTVFLNDTADHREYETMFARYKKFKPDIQTEFVDPEHHPELVTQNNIKFLGEMVVQYSGRHESVQHLGEREITGALQRLADTNQYYVVFLQGDGERAIDSGAQDGYDQFADYLRSNGLKAQGLNLVQTPKIPDNTSILVVAQPTQKLLPGVEKIVADYLAAGGNLLWLADPDQHPGLLAVAQSLGLSWQDGFAVFPNYELVGSPSPLIYLTTQYPPTPVTQGLDSVAAFPLVRAFKTTTNADWQEQPLLQTDQYSWLDSAVSLDSTDKSITLEQKATDPKGPLTFGAIFTRTRKAEGAAPGRTQRVAVVGNTNFLANSYLDAYGNKRLGLNLMQWLAARDTQINIDVPTAPDTVLYLPGVVSLLIIGGYALILPALLLGYGTMRWLRRRRA